MEIEAKYRIPDNRTYIKLKSLVSVGKFTISPGHLLKFHDTYFDTEERKLWNAGLVLRKRQYDDQVVVTLKSLTPPLDTIHRREEVEMKVPGIKIDQLNTWPDMAFSNRIWHITGGSDLVPIFSLHQHRFERDIIRNGVIVAELCIDQMQCRSGDSDITYSGLEVELTGGGTEQDLEKILKKLENTFDLIPEKASKLEVALSYAQVPGILTYTTSEIEPPDITLDDSMATAALKTFRYHFEMMKKNDAGSYRGDDIEYVHDMRVAVRRMRTAYRVFEPYLDQEEMRPFLKTLKKTGRTLGVVRDLDVFRDNLEEHARKNRIQLGSSTLSATWNTAYINARCELIDYLESRRYQEFREEFSLYIDRVLLTCSSRPTVSESLWQTLENQKQQCTSYYRQIEKLVPVPMYGFHQLRIYLKHFRYTIEYFRNILGETGEQTITQTKVVQDHLGALQDAVVAQKCIRSVLQWGAWYPPQQPYTLIPAVIKHSADVERYLSDIEISIDQLTSAFSEVWRNFTDFLAIHTLGVEQKTQNKL
jgi:CHAD domain-containing protein